MSIYDRLGVRRVINASGRMTSLGGAVLDAAVVAAMAEAAGAHVELAELKRAAAARIAALCGAEAACLTAGAAAAVAVMVAAAVAGTDPARIVALPQADWQPQEILLQAGHLIDFGAPVEQMVRLGGGRPVVVGAVNLVRTEDLAARIGPRTAAVLFVQSHHAVRRGMLALPEVVAVARAAGVPVLVDAAAEEDLRWPLAAGADLVAYSGGKAPAGPTSGFILGRRALVDACLAQERGIARAMKIGKEAIAGLVAALEAYVARDAAAEAARRHGLAADLRRALADIPGLRVGTEADEAGRDIPRVTVAVAPGAPFTLAELVAGLQSGSPAIYPRTHHLGEGWIAFDPRPLGPDDVARIAARLRAIVAGSRP